MGREPQRDERNGEAMALWPMPADQVAPFVLPDGSMVYQYELGGNVAVLAAENVLHLKGLGNGTVGLAKLEFMRATTDEAAKAQASAARIFGNGGKPTGVLMVDNVLKPEQRTALSQRFAEMARFNYGSTVIMLFPPGAVALDPIASESPTRLGRRLGRVIGA